MQDDVIITCAVTGGADTTRLSPHVPVTPRQIADEAIRAARAGAAIVHVHVRDPITGLGSMDLGCYRETVHRIRDSGVDVLINLTTGPGARFFPSAENPRVGDTSSSLSSPEQRVAHVLELKPEVCSLDVGTFNMGDNAMINVPLHLSRMAQLVQREGVQPELEVFDLGHIRLARHLLSQGYITGTPLFQLCLGVPWGAPADAQTMLAMRDYLPPGSSWSAFGISRDEFPCVALGAVLGGHVRVGLEDNLYIARGRLASGNAELVHQAVRIVEAIGGRIAGAEDARKVLGLRPAQ